MKDEFPSYEKLFEETKRRLIRLKKIASSKTGELEDQDAFIFMIIGNINLRFNTICSLIEKHNFDGIFALQRTFFEMQLAFELYMKSENKDKYIELYWKKNNYETVLKWSKLIQQSNEDGDHIFNSDDMNQTKEWKRIIHDELKQTINKGHTKTWYELAAGKSVRELSYDCFSAIEYFDSYDEASNWVHPQRLHLNMDDNFKQTLNGPYLILLLRIIKSDIRWLGNDMDKLCKHLRIDKSKKLTEYFNMLINFDREVTEFANHVTQRN